MQVGKPVLYVDASNVRHDALCKVIKTRTDNDHVHRLAAATAQPIDLVYVDGAGTIQTVTNVPAQGNKGSAGFYTEVIP